MHDRDVPSSPMCPKMLFKKLPGLQPSASQGSGDCNDTSVKREHEPDTQHSGLPLKKLAVQCSATAPHMLLVQEVSTSSTTGQQQSKEVEHFKRKVQELETELSYTRGDLQHEQARWSHFRRRAQRCNIWGVLMGVSDLPDAEPQPFRNAAHAEALLDIEAQLDQVQESLVEETARAQALLRETERLAADNQQLQRQLMMQKAQDALVTDKVLEHPLYKKVLACYHQERLLGQKCAQHLEMLKAEMALECRRCRTMQETLEDQEKRRRKRLEQALYERDHRLLEKEAAVKDLNYRLKKLEAVAEQAAYEQQKLKEYPGLITSLKKEMEKLRARLDRQRREGREEDLAAEVESISKAYEDLSEQNGRLLQQLDEKDRLNNNLLTERLKNQHNISLLKAEVEANAQALEVNEKLRANQEAWMLKMQDVFQTLQSEEKQLARQCRDFQTVAGQREQEATALRLEVEELRQQTARQQEAAQQFAVQAEQLVRHNSEASDDSRRKGEELQRLQSKYEWLRKKSVDTVHKPAATESQDAAELREQILGLRAVLNCNVCGRRRKNTILTRCFHIFCAECVEDNIRDRKRKCPQCATKFSESDVKTVFLCEK
eukprot:GGOE01040879.1.p1 GENE.GGOE01040879.1~~GGOE01040879.1.p1  ORF type:complete len:625 (-),score=160.79 GGOE01040879.1:111-1922(-)